MAFVEMDPRLSDVLHMEGDKYYSRKLVTLLTGAGVIKMGTVLGKITASSKYIAYDNDAADGSEVADAILLRDADVSSGDVEAVVLIRFGMVKKNGLVWGAGVTTQPEKDAAYVDLEAKSMPILVRTDV